MSLKNLSFRQASKADWPAIQALLLANKLPIDGAEAHLSTFIVAANNGELVAVTGAEVYDDLALLRSVAVKPGLHRQGIGGSLVGLILQEAKRRGIRQVFLLTTTAADYFPRFGFALRPRDQAPAALQTSAEFQGACPSSAVFMGVALTEEAATATKTGCCGGRAKNAPSACCALDEQKKAQGEPGCGCSTPASQVKSTSCCG